MANFIKKMYISNELWPKLKGKYSCKVKLDRYSTPQVLKYCLNCFATPATAL